MKRFIKCLLVSVAILVIPGEALADKRIALVIGNARYSHIKALKNPANDAPDLAGALRSLGFEVMLRTDAGKGDFDRSLAEFARKASAQDVDAALFYYAGHGMQYQRQNYLLPTDIEVQDDIDVEFQTVAMDRVQRALERAKGVKIMILDACRDNPLAQQVATRSAGETRGLARIDKTTGLIVAYATAPDDVAQDGVGRNSPFTEALIKRMKEPGLEIGTMFRRVTADVYERTNGKQRPEVSISLLNDYFLNPTEGDGTVWNRIRDRQEPEEFRRFIEKFPTSPYAREAQYRLDLFERIRRENEERVRLEQRLAASKAEDERRANEQAEKDRRAKEKAEAERKEAERIAAEQKTRQDLAKAEAERKQAEQLALAKKAEDERRARDEAEAKRKEAERLAAAKAEEERRAREQAEAQRKEALRLAAEKKAADDAARKSALAEEARKEAEQRAAQKAEEERLAKEAAEAHRLEAERLAAEKKAADEKAKQAARDEQDRQRQQVEQEKKRLAELCARETSELGGLGANPDAIDAFRKRATCPNIAAAIDRAERDARKALARLCADERSQLGSPKSKDLEALKGAAAKLTCGDVREEARIRIARLEEEATARQKTCDGETQSLKAIDPTLVDAQDRLKTLRRGLTCDAAIAQLNDVMGKLEQRTKQAQTELARLSCYGGPVTGRFDETTQKSVSRYLSRKGTVVEARLTDDLVSELKNQSLGVCPEETTSPPVASRPDVDENVEPQDESSRKRVKRARREEREEPPVARPAPARKSAAREEEEPPRRRIREEEPERRRPAIREPREPAPVRQRPAVAERPRPAPVAAVRRAPSAAPAPQASGGGSGGGHTFGTGF